MGKTKIEGTDAKIILECSKTKSPIFEPSEMERTELESLLSAISSKSNAVLSMIFDALMDLQAS